MSIVMKVIMVSNRSLSLFRSIRKILPGLVVLVLLTLVAYSPAREAGDILDDKQFYINDPLSAAPDGLFRI